MVEKVRFYLDEDALTELQDQYIDKEADLRKELQSFIKNMFVNTKATDLNKTIVCGMETEENGQKVMKQTPIKFEDIDFSKYEIKHNPDWKPKEIPNPQFYELSVGDATWKKLLMEAKYFAIKVDKYNGSLSDKKKKADVPTCFEECMFQNLYKPTMDLILKKVGDVCDDEFEELEKLVKEEEDKKKPPTAGSREKPKEA